ncbi:MAG: hypothetical protein HY706_02680 [Candidatus Hydrogenedentes bacterium]|nr:hypothetical protein [Candidatus Hydrogenedentota bacterium]
MIKLVLMVPLAMMAGSVAAQKRPVFESLGIPVVKAGFMGVIVGPGSEVGSERFYFNFRQDGGKLFLVAVDPDTGNAEQYQSPAGTGAWGLIVGPDNRIYLGTHEGPDPEDSGRILVFDPKHPEKQIQVVGRPSETETYIWQFTIGPDKKLYGCTYGNAKLISYEPGTGEMADLGRMDETQLYTRSICTGPDGRIYLGIGYGRANVVVYDPKTREHKAILADEYRSHPSQTAAGVYTGTDGNVYVTGVTRMQVVNGDPQNAEITRAESVTLVVKGDHVEETSTPADAASQTTLKDGRRLENPTLNGTYNLAYPDGRREPRTFQYKGAGSGIFMVYAGPMNRIYGGTYMPNELFWFDPATGKSENPGNPTEVGGEIYSMLSHHGQLYACAYPGSFLSKWDPTKPWNYGREPQNNPRGFGPLGPGHLRPRAMIHGPDERIYIGSYPEYGLVGGSLGVWDPVQDKLVENYHHLIKNQSIVGLVYDPKSGLVFGGSSTAGGGGSTPVEPEAKFFAFDPAKKGLAFEEVPCPGAQSIRSLARVSRRIFGVAAEDQLFVYDVESKTYVHKAALGVGEVLDCSLGLWEDRYLYGLSSNKVFRIDPETYEVRVLATFDGDIRCGFAMDERGIYFGHRATLMRYNWRG